MSYELDPTAGQWYRQIDKEQLFRVVSIDEDDDLIAIQYVDGEREELDSETWFTIDLELSETPEDWIDPDGSGDADALDTDADVEEKDDADWRAPPKASKKPRDDWDDDEDDDGDDWDDDDSDDGYGSDD